MKEIDEHIFRRRKTEFKPAILRYKKAPIHKLNVYLANHFAREKDARQFLKFEFEFSFLFPKQVAEPKLKNPIYPTIYQ